MEKFQLFSLSDMQGRPAEMFKMKNKEGFFCLVPIPLPQQVVVMARGEWPLSVPTFTVTMHIGHDLILQLGHLTSTCRCLMWDRTTCKENLPSESKQGLAEAKVMVEPMTPTSSQEQEAEAPALSMRPSINSPSWRSASGSHSQQSVIPSPAKTSPAAPPALMLGTASPAPRPRSGTPSRKLPAPVSSSPAAVASSGGAESAGDASSSLSPQPGCKVQGMQAVNETTPQSQASTPSAAKRPRKTRGKQTMDLNTSTQTEDPTPTKTRTGSKSKRDKSPEPPSDDPTPIKKKSGSVSKPAAADLGTPPGKSGRHEWRKRSLVKDLPAPTPGTSGASASSSSLQDADTRTARCRDVTSRVGSLPSKRWGHTMVWVGSQQAVLIGGQGERQHLAKDSIWTLATDTRRWKSLEVTSENQKPECRMGHSATFDPTLRCIYVYGGSKHLKWFHDVHMFDMDKHSWQLMKVNGKAPMRAYHSATLHRHEVWVFGGVYPRPNPNPDGCSNELHIFSPFNENWYAPLVTGDKPEPRSGHSANLIGSDQLVVFGGWDFPICFNDLHILDMTTLDWSKPVIQGQPPKPRSWHGACTLSKQRVLIHGGYDGDNALDDCFIFTLGTLTWTKIMVAGAPVPRCGHTALCLPYTSDNEEEDEVLIFGGGDNDGVFFNDLFSLYVPFKAAPAEAEAV